MPKRKKPLQYMMYIKIRNAANAVAAPVSASLLGEPLPSTTWRKLIKEMKESDLEILKDEKEIILRQALARALRRRRRDELGLERTAAAQKDFESASDGDEPLLWSVKVLMRLNEDEITFVADQAKQHGSRSGYLKYLIHSAMRRAARSGAA